jgi:N-acetylglucosamine-6-sulfatase
MMYRHESYKKRKSQFGRSLSGGLVILVFFLFLFGCKNSKESRQQLPNIIFILVDDMRWDQLGISGHPFIQTPNIDRIGKEGVIFTNAFVCTPLCSPSRASFLTGQYPHKNRIINNDRNGLSFISHKLVTFPMLLRRAGYETAFIGKWHMGDDDTRRPGFDHWISFRAQGLFIDPVVNIDGQRRQYTGYMTDLLNQWSAEFLKEKHDKPFLLYLSHKAVHAPFIPAKRHQNQYADQSYQPLPIDSGDLQGKPSLTRILPPVDVLTIPGATPEPAEPRYGRGKEKNNIYLDHHRCLSSVDEGVGMIFDILEQKNELDNTLIIFASDNGFHFGEHGLFMDKRVPYEESLRIPLLMRYPELIKAGSKRAHMALNIDVAPTLYELAGIESPVPIHGKSLLPILRDSTLELRSEFLAEYYLEKISPINATWQAVRSPNWKYIRYPELPGRDELYDLQNDPGELKNLFNNREYQTRTRQMKEKLQQLLINSEGVY